MSPPGTDGSLWFSRVNGSQMRGRWEGWGPRQETAQTRLVECRLRVCFLPEIPQRVSDRDRGRERTFIRRTRCSGLRA